MKGKLKSYLLLITGSLVFLFLPLLFSPHPPEEEFFFFTKASFRDFLANLLMLLFFFLNFYVLIPAFYIKKKYTFYGFVLIISLLIVCIVPSLLTGHNPFTPQNNFLSEIHKPDRDFMPKRPNGFFFLEEIRHHIFLFTAVVFSSAFLREKIRNKIIENEKLQAELSHLKTQIHPHFLFNTLNSIYALSIKNDEKAADTIVKLSEFMRYLLNDSSKDEVILKKEINYIDNYIDLQKARLRNSVDLEYRTNGAFSNYTIAPLLLFPFIENAFKYGVNPDESSVVKINIQLNETHLNMTVFNHKVSVKNIESSKIGLQNTYDRLELYYPKKHSLNIEEDRQTYYVNLKIELV